MTDKTHCDRCGDAGPHKNGREHTPNFPAVVEMSGFEVMLPTQNEYDLCLPCSRELATFLGDDDMAEKLSELTDEERDA